MNRWMNGWINKQMDRQIDKKANRRRNRLMGGWMDRWKKKRNLMCQNVTAIKDGIENQRVCGVCDDIRASA